MSAVFEGSEKKLEIVFKPGSAPLRALPDSFWASVVSAAGAKILSKIENEELTAFLLSESSLFVWNDCLLMITCGTTTLVDTVKALTQRLPVEAMGAFFFERKNEYFPHRQKSDFYDDISILRQYLPIESYRLGRADEHHIFLSHSKNLPRGSQLDQTLEVLMYDLQGQANEVFSNPKSSIAEIRRRTQVHEIFKGYKIDDFCFDPTGYSLNAIKGGRFFTVHVTPQEISPYVSFETNVAQTEKQVTQALNAVLEIFRPSNFDVVYFDEKGQDQIIDVPSFKKRTYVRHQLGPDFFVQFRHFTQEFLRVEKAIPVTPI